MQVGELIHKLALKSGIPSDSTELITVLSDKRLSEISVPDSIAQTLDTSLISEPAAEARLQGKMKAKYYGESLSVVEAALKEAALENGLTEDEYKELWKDKATPSNIKSTLKKAVEKQTRAGKGSTEDLQKKIEELNEKLAQTNRTYQEEKERLLLEKENEITDLQHRTALSSFAYDDRFDKNTMMEIHRLKLQEELSKLGGTIKRANGDLGLFDSNGSPLFDATGNKVTYKDFIAKVAADNKLLKTAEPAKASTSASPSHPGESRATATRGLQAVEQSLADLG